MNHQAKQHLGGDSPSLSNISGLISSLFLMLFYLVSCSTITKDIDGQALRPTSPGFQSFATDTPSPIESTVPDQPTNVLSPTITNAPTNSLREISPEDISLSVQWMPLEEISDVNTMLVLPSQSSVAEHPSVSLQVINWQGDRSPFISIQYIGDVLHDGFGLFIAPLPNSSTSLLVGPVIFSRLSEFYLIDYEQEKIIGFETGCNSFLSTSKDIALGLDYLVYRCDESRDLLHILSIDDPSVVKTIELPENILFPLNYRLSWKNKTTLVLNDVFNRGICISRAPGWELHCWESSDWIDNLSPNGESFEIRYGQFDTRPESLGIQNVDCLSDNSPCESKLRPGWVPTGGDFFLDRAAWLPEGNKLLYTVHQDTIFSNNEPDETEFYLLDIETMSVELVGHYDKYLTFNPINPSPRPDLWSPDGKWIVVSEGTDYYLLSVVTGELKPFTQGGYILGEIDLSGLAPQ